MVAVEVLMNEEAMEPLVLVVGVPKVEPVPVWYPLHRSSQSVVAERMVCVKCHGVTRLDRSVLGLLLESTAVCPLAVNTARGGV